MVSVVLLILWGNLLIAALNLVAMFGAASLLVVETREYRAWHPTSLGGRISKRYVDGFYSLRHGRGKGIVVWSVAEMGVREMWEQSEANARMKVLAEAENFRIAPHLWSGISSVRPGAGVAIVGNPAQVADTIHQFVEIGCTEFCLSGYPHDLEAERFGRLVMPYFADRLATN